VAPDKGCRIHNFRPRCECECFWHPNWSEWI